MDNKNKIIEEMAEETLCRQNSPVYNRAWSDYEKKIAVKEFAEKQKNALKKFIWKHNIPECIFYDVTGELLKE